MSPQRHLKGTLASNGKFGAASPGSFFPAAFTAKTYNFSSSNYRLKNRWAFLLQMQLSPCSLAIHMLSVCKGQQGPYATCVTSSVAKLSLHLPWPLTNGSRRQGSCQQLFELFRAEPIKSSLLFKFRSVDSPATEHCSSGFMGWLIFVLNAEADPSWQCPGCTEWLDTESTWRWLWGQLLRAPVRWRSTAELHMCFLNSFLVLY